MTHIHEFHFENRGENVISKKELLQIGDKYESEIAAARKTDAVYR